MTDTKITSATVETSTNTAVTTAILPTKFTVETDLIKSAFPILRAVAENKRNPRGLLDCSTGFTADNTIVFEMRKNYLTLKAADVKNRICLSVENIPIENFGAPCTFAFQSGRFDVFQKVLQKMKGDNIKFSSADGLLEIIDEMTFSFVSCDTIDEGRQEFLKKIFPTGNGKTLFAIDADILGGMLKKVEGIIPQNDNRFQNVIFKIENNELKIIAGQGNAAGLTKNPVKAKDCKFILPSKCLKPVKQLIQNHLTDELIEFRTNGDKIQIVSNEIFTTVLTIPTEEKAPLENADKFFVTETVENICVDAEKFKNTAETAMALAYAQNIAFTADAKYNGFDVICFSQNAGQVKIFERAEHIYSEIDFTLSCAMLKMALPALSGGELKIFNDTKGVIFTANDFSVIITRAKVDAEFAGMSFQNKRDYLMLKNRIDRLSNLTAIKSAKYKLAKDTARNVFFRKRNTLEKIEISLHTAQPDETFTAEIISEGIKTARAEFATFKAKYDIWERNFDSQVERRMEFLNAMAKKQKESLQKQLDELLNRKAA